MKLAFCIPEYFPFGGRQRNFLRIAQYCHAQGHHIVIYTRKWENDVVPAGFQLYIVPVRAFSNHKRDLLFSRKLRPLLAQGDFDGVIGFGKMPGLDIYYAADPCFKARGLNQRSVLYRLTSRYRHFVALEKAVFRADGDTEILMLTELEIPRYQACYDTPQRRFHLLPPGINRDYMAPDNLIDLRNQLRHASGIARDHRLVLLIGSDFRRKGLDRVLRGIASLPKGLQKKTHLWVVGQSKTRAFRVLAACLGIKHLMRFVTGCTDLSRFFFAADLLVHPAYVENTGNVLVEAMVAGVPVLTTANCGYAVHVERADAGKVLPIPFQQQQFNKALMEMLQSPLQDYWSRNGIGYGRRMDLYSRPEVATEKILAILASRRR